MKILLFYFTMLNILLVEFKIEAIKNYKNKHYCSKYKHSRTLNIFLLSNYYIYVFI